MQVIKIVLLLYFSEGGKLITLWGSRKHIFYISKCLCLQSKTCRCYSIYCNFCKDYHNKPIKVCSHIQRWRRNYRKAIKADLKSWCPYQTEITRDISKKLYFKLEFLVLFVCLLSFFSLCFSSFSQVDKRSHVSLKMDQWFQIDCWKSRNQKERKL